jgi:3-phosphoshikimate 1-carboxyvinyltransferase
MYTTEFLDLPGCPARHGHAARLQEHLQPRAAAGSSVRRHDGGARPAGLRRHAGHAAGAAQLGCGVEQVRSVVHITGLGGRAPSAPAPVHGQCRHRHAPADRRAGGAGRRLSNSAACRACTSAPSAIWSMRCARWAAPSTTSAEGFPAAAHRPALNSGWTAHPRARRRVEPVPDRLADGPAAGGATRHRDRGGGELISRPYIEITLNLLARFGIAVQARGLAAFHHPARQPYQFARRLSMSRPMPRLLAIS